MRNKRFRFKSLDEQFDDMDHSVAAFQTQRDSFSNQKKKDKLKRRQIAYHKRYQKVLDNCFYCIDAPKLIKHLIVSLGAKMYLSLPAIRRVVEDQCCLIPMEHIPAATAFDEEVFSEMEYFQKHLVKMFAAQKKGVVFIEIVHDVSHKRHTVINCIPLPLNLYNQAPIYFKKAILESDEQWSQHKKIIDTRKKSFRRSVPKNFSYFYVSFGMNGGFAHIIEDKNKISTHFGLEIICGMLEKSAQITLRAVRARKDIEFKRVKEFLKSWEKFDWTKKLDGGAYAP